MLGDEIAVTIVALPYDFFNDSEAAHYRFGVMTKRALAQERISVFAYLVKTLHKVYSHPIKYLNSPVAEDRPSAIMEVDSTQLRGRDSDFKGAERASGPEISPMDRLMTRMLMRKSGRVHQFWSGGGIC